jgi:TonB family protein
MLTDKTLQFEIARFDRGVVRTGLRAATVAMVIIGMLSGARIARAADEKIYDIGNGVAAPKVLSKVEPDYTQEAQDRGVQGTVFMSLVIGTDGRARDIEVQRGIGAGLDEKAVEALQEWRFEPGIKDGMPVAVRAHIEINFRRFRP